MTLAHYNKDLFSVLTKQRKMSESQNLQTTPIVKGEPCLLYECLKVITPRPCADPILLKKALMRYFLKMRRYSVLYIRYGEKTSSLLKHSEKNHTYVSFDAEQHFNQHQSANS